MRVSRPLLALGFAGVLLLAVGVMKIVQVLRSRGTAAEAVQALEQMPQLPAGGWETLLVPMIQGGTLPDLRRPGFSNLRADLENFYAPSRYEPAWVKGKRATPQAMAAVEILQNAEGKGLNAEDYDGPGWSRRIQMLQRPDPPASAADVAQFDLGLTVALMRYVSDVHMGRVNPRTLHASFNIGPAKYDLAQFLRQRLVDAQDVKTALEAAEPPFMDYRQAEKALATYIRLEREDGGGEIPVPVESVKRGEQYPGIARLVKLLRLLGDLPTDAVVPEGADVYTADIEAAVKRFQERHGLDVDGRLGRATIAQLNTPLARRVRQLQLALERWRWLPHEFSRPPIIVNIPEFQLRAWDEQGKVALKMRVVVGRAYHNETPVFAEDMIYMIFRPYWNVPYSIQRSELIPQIRKNREYLAKNGFEVTDNRGSVVNTGAVSDELLEDLRRGLLYIRQRPGPTNSLGLVAFMFPNEFDVYLHGTPAMNLFAMARRDFSHGCIRVEFPEKLADWVLREQPLWNEDRIRAAMQGQQSLQVNLDRTIPVLIYYTTAVVSEDGTVKFLPDIYGYDAVMEKILAKEYSMSTH